LSLGSESLGIAIGWLVLRVRVVRLSWWDVLAVLGLRLGRSASRKRDRGYIRVDQARYPGLYLLETALDEYSRQISVEISSHLVYTSEDFGVLVRGHTELLLEIIST
jgi:hypothetical protein